MARKRRSREELKEVDAVVERLRDYIRLNYVTAAEVARQIGVSRRTLERALRDAAAAGAVWLETGKTGTRLALA